jgi:hypothetical protein
LGPEGIFEPRHSRSHHLLKGGLAAAFLCNHDHTSGCLNVSAEKRRHPLTISGREKGLSKSLDGSRINPSTADDANALCLVSRPLA